MHAEMVAIPSLCSESNAAVALKAWRPMTVGVVQGKGAMGCAMSCQSPCAVERSLMTIRPTGWRRKSQSSWPKLVNAHSPVSLARYYREIGLFD